MPIYILSYKIFNDRVNTDSISTRAVVGWWMGDSEFLSNFESKPIDTSELILDKEYLKITEACELSKLAERNIKQ